MEIEKMYVIRNNKREFWDGVTWVSLKSALIYSEYDKMTQTLPPAGEWYVPRSFNTPPKRRRLVYARATTLYFSIHYHHSKSHAELYGYFHTSSRNELSKLVKEVIQFYEFPMMTYDQLRIVSSYPEWVNLGWDGKVIELVHKSRVLTIQGMNDRTFDMLTLKGD